MFARMYGNALFRCCQGLADCKIVKSREVTFIAHILYKGNV